MTVTTCVTGFKKWALILALCFILQRSPLRAQVASAPGAVAFGLATASGNYSLAAGASTAIGVYSTAFGVCSTASGYSSISNGFLSTASGTYGMAFGAGATAIGVNSIALGFNLTAIGPCSVALGGNSTASGNNSTAFGHCTTASAENSFVVGAYNVGGAGPTVSGTDPVFEIGNGYYNSATSTAVPSDALVVYRNGSATFQGPVTVAPGGDIPMFSGY